MLPQDPFILLSFINTKLRDHYPTLDDLCVSLGVERVDLERRLGDVGFEYSAEQNKFW